MTPQDWATLGRLLDEALDLAPPDRERWLDGLAAEHAALEPRLRAMLASTPDDDDAFLESLPRLDLDALAGVDGLRLHGGEPGARVGPYRLVRELAAGGQGTVWLAEREDGVLKRPVALKLPMGLAFRPHLAARMARERDILARLTHPHIARLYDAGIAADGTPYLALEYVDGQPIDRHCDAAGLSIRARVRLFVDVVRAVAYAHGRLALHRDLKPSNVLVTPAGDVRLLDFGIARLLGSARAGQATLTTERGAAMTLLYASPEQVSGAPLDVATDIYSLGVMLYELLAGVGPYRPARDTVAALEEAILQDDPVPPSRATPHPERCRPLRGDLDTIVLKALAKRPDDRYATASALADDLERFLDGHPVLARRATLRYRAGKFMRRHRVAVAATAVATVAVMGGAAAAAWQARAARAEQARAEAVTAYIAGIFKDADPGLQGDDRPITAADLLRRARTRVDAELTTEPETRATLLHILGDSLVGIGEPAGAADVLRAALDEARRLHGPDAPSTVEALLSLASAEQFDARSSRATEALAEARAALARTGRLASEAGVRLRVLDLRVLLNRGQAGTDEAEAVGLEAWTAAGRLLPASHPIQAEVADLLSTVFRTRGQVTRALEFAERAYQASLAAHGPTHPRVIQAENVYGRALYEADRPEEAIRHLKAAAASGEVVYRENGLYLQHLLGTLANIQLAYGEIKEAVVNLERALATDLRGAVVSDTYLASQQMVQARAYLAARRPADALSHLERAESLLARTNNASLRRTLAVEHASALLDLGRVAQARARLGDLESADTARLGGTDLRIQFVRARLAARAGRADEALARLERAAAATPANPGARLVWAEVQLALAQARLDLNALADAAIALQAADEMVRRVQPRQTPLSADIAAAYGRLARARGDLDEAARWQVASDAFWKDFGPAPIAR